MCKPWIECVPYDTRQLVIKEFVANVKAMVSNFRAKNTTHIGTMKFRSRKDHSQTCHFTNDAIHNRKLIMLPRYQNRNFALF
jgi:hypothetical protein